MTPSVPEPSISSTLPSHLRTEGSGGILLDRTESFDTAAELEIKLKSRPKPRSGNRVRLNSTPVQVSHARTSRVSGTSSTEVEPVRAENERIPGPQEKSRTESPRPASPGAPLDVEKARRTYTPEASPTKESRATNEPEEESKPLWRKSFDRFSSGFWANRHVAWIYPKMKDWNEMRPVIRCAVAVSYRAVQIIHKERLTEFIPSRPGLGFYSS
jgi:hypothetical protein